MIRTVEICDPDPVRTLLPFAEPVLLLENGAALVPLPFGGHAPVATRVGLAVGWSPAPELGGILLCIIAGAIDADMGVAVSLSREGLAALIGDLESIERQLDARP